MDAQQPAGRVPVEIVISPALRADETHGAFPFASISSKLLGIENAVFVFDPRNNRVLLQASCNCSVEVSLSALVMGLHQVMSGTGHLASGSGGVH